MTTRDKLLARANAFSVPSYGVEVTPRMLREWVADGLVPGPVRSAGRGYKSGVPQDWSALAYRRILQLCRLKHRGIHRGTLQVTALWLAGAEYPFAVVRPAVMEEYRRHRNRARRPMPPGWDPRVGERSPSAFARRFLSHGPSDTVPSDADAAAAEAALAAMVYGENLLPTAQAWYAPDGPLTRLMGGELPPDETGVVEEEAQFGVGMLLGLLGDPEEAAETVEARLVAANAETFANARDWALAWPTAVQLSLPLFAWAGSPVSGFAELWERVRSTPNDPVGRLALFAVFLSRCQVRGHQGRPFAQLARIVGPARRMASFIGANDDARRILEEEVRGMFPTEDLADPVVLLFCAAQVPNRRAALRVARLLWPHGLADYRRLSKGMQTNRNRATIG